ncbi:conserved Plasmodium protein, unknown function [Plasmodium gallinaceum]|uniref:Uncharacterized protein n=1 Tax=Plasmodium gallinaceum TaxID=5849 RepID=A0A1J1GYU0_PLAGA|nr:conserved Plasmodium protein, unknown function [Plasmodium gallinaceum]CRG97738.1 conserved Plasmodium protein, unknown function [Plasmodium gallinaceum]
MLKSSFETLLKLSQQCAKNCFKNKNEILSSKKIYFSDLVNKRYKKFNFKYLSFPFLKYNFSFTFNKNISTKRRRYFKIRKHQKKKYKKKRMGLSTIPWIPTKEKIRTYKLPRQSKLINKRFMRDKKGGRRYRLKKQR